MGFLRWFCQSKELIQNWKNNIVHFRPVKKNGRFAVICLLTEGGIPGINAKAEFIYGKQNLMGLLKYQSLIVPPM